MRWILIVSLPFLIAQCSSLPKTMALSGAVGGASGLGIGAATGLNTRGQILTTSLGAIAGALVGYLIPYGKPKAMKHTPHIPREPGPPILTDAETESVWIPDRIEGSRYIQGHWTYEIKTPPVWTLKEPKEKRTHERHAK